MFEVGKKYKSRDGKYEYEVLKILDKPDKGNISIIACYEKNGAYLAMFLYEGGRAYGKSDSCYDMMPNIIEAKYKVGDKLYERLNESIMGSLVNQFYISLKSIEWSIEWSIVYSSFNDKDGNWYYSIKNEDGLLKSIPESSIEDCF